MPIKKQKKSKSSSGFRRDTLLARDYHLDMRSRNGTVDILSQSKPMMLAQVAMIAVFSVFLNAEAAAVTSQTLTPANSSEDSTSDSINYSSSYSTNYPAYYPPSHPASHSAPKKQVPYAQQNRPKNPALYEDDRTLAGHSYFRNGVLAFPFVAPYINSSLESALASFNVPGADQELKTVGLSPSVTGQMKFGKVGIEAGAQLSELFGADSYTAYVVGATFTYGFNGALRYEAVRDRKFAITPALFYSYENGMGFSPLSAADAAINSPETARAANLLEKTSLQEIRPSLLGAYTISPVVGLSGEVGINFDQNKTGDQSQSSKFLRAGIGADANFTPYHVPVGAAAFFRDEVSLGSSQSPSPILGAGVYEMFHQSFNFGLEVSRLMTSTPTLSILLSLTAYY